ncbi:hypothetical protein BJV78DRAFT_1278498 [Lactifluus subvellereus]|nr:hypothetical protein BJV78DRAFT_1278498 [Lactifluus subvellereus]
MDCHPEPGAHQSFPRFHPHVTLAIVKQPSPAPSPSAAESAASPGAPSRAQAELLLTLREAVPLGQPAVPVRFGRVVAGDHYYRSIYVVLLLSRELVELRAALGRNAALGTPSASGSAGPAPPAFPHLSLYYIADEEAHARARVLQELEREDVVGPSADGRGVALRCAGGGRGGGEGAAVALEGFTGTQIWIVDCEGPVEGWKVLDRILLAKADR